MLRNNMFELLLQPPPLWCPFEGDQKCWLLKHLGGGVCLSSVAFCSPAKSLTFSKQKGEHPRVSALCSALNPDRCPRISSHGAPAAAMRCRSIQLAAREARTKGRGGAFGSGHGSGASLKGSQKKGTRPVARGYALGFLFRGVALFKPKKGTMLYPWRSGSGENKIRGRYSWPGFLKPSKGDDTGVALRFTGNRKGTRVLSEYP